MESLMPIAFKLICGLEHILPKGIAHCFSQIIGPAELRQPIRKLLLV